MPSLSQLLVVVESPAACGGLQDTLTQPRTKELTAALSRWGVDPTDHTLLIADQMFDNLHLAGRNIRKLTFNTTSNLNVYDVLRADKIIVESSALKFIQEFYGAAAAGEEAEAGELDESTGEEVSGLSGEIAPEAATAEIGEEAGANEISEGP